MTTAPIRPLFSFTTYQQAAVGFRNNALTADMLLAIAALGAAGEAGEIADEVKKHLGHGHPFNRDKLEKEIGDTLWYLASLCDLIGTDLGAVARQNIEKLQARYPDGFSAEASMNRSGE